MLRAEKKEEEIYQIRSIFRKGLHFLPASGDLFLAAVKDDPAWSDQDLAALLSHRELTGRRGGAAARAWLLGRLAAKAAAGRRWGASPGEMEIRPGQGGRPWCFLALTPAGFISLSHTRGAAVAVAASRPVGLDLEPWSRPLSDRAWSWSFTPQERLLAEGSGLFPARLAMWCAKEAAAKSWGLGLLRHLSQVRVAGTDWPGGSLTVTWQGRKKETSEVCLSRWEAYLVALAQPETEGEAVHDV